MDRELILQDVGDRIRAERKARGWTGLELARHAGTNLSCVRRIENGLGGYTNTLLRVCEALGTTPAYLFSEGWTAPQPDPTLTPRLTRVLKSIEEGGSLTEAGDRIGLSRVAMASDLSRIYVRLGVRKWSTYTLRRKEAIEIARKHNLI